MKSMGKVIFFVVCAALSLALCLFIGSDRGPKGFIEIGHE